MKLNHTHIISKMIQLWAKMPYTSYCVSGQDAPEFLQGQLTQDVNVVKPHTCHFAAYCNHKGQMLAVILLYRDGNGRLFMRLHNERAAHVINRLKMFVLRSDVVFEEQPATVIGLNSDFASYLCQQHSKELPKPFHSDVLTVDGCRVVVNSLPHNYAELVVVDGDCDGDGDGNKVEQLLADITAENEIELNQLKVGAGYFDIKPETNELLLPQQTPLADWNAISYTKGCYIGQEIIARNKYLGAVRKHLAIAHTPAISDVAIGDPVKRGARAVGQIIEYVCNTEKGSGSCLAILADKQLGEDCLIHNELVRFGDINQQ